MKPRFNEEIDRELSLRVYDDEKANGDIRAFIRAASRGDLKSHLTVEGTTRMTVRFFGDVIGQITPFGSVHAGQAFAFPVEDGPVDVTEIEVFDVGTYTEPISAAMAVLEGFFDGIEVDA